MQAIKMSSDARGHSAWPAIGTVCARQSQAPHLGPTGLASSVFSKHASPQTQGAGQGAWKLLSTGQALHPACSQQRQAWLMSLTVGPTQGLTAAASSGSMQ